MTTLTKLRWNEGRNAKKGSEERDCSQVIIHCFSGSFVIEKLRNGMGARRESKYKRFPF